MSVKATEKIMIDFIKGTEPAVLAVKGHWGTGKTETWSRTYKANSTQLGLNKYCYFSLFGVNTLAEIKTSILLSSIRLRSSATESDPALTHMLKWVNDAKEGFTKITGKLTKKAEPIANTNQWSKWVSPAFDAYAQSQIAETLIVLDDFERMNDAISAEQLLGLVSYLKVEKKCRVVIIFNDGRLEKKREAYETFREKVVDIEVQFAPTASEASHLAFSNCEIYKDEMISYAETLSISNIRVLGKIRKNVELISSIVSIHPEVAKNAIMSTVLLTWAYFDRHDNVPTIDFIKKWNRFSWVSSESQRTATPNEEGWARLLQEYGYIQTDDLDLAILKVIERGHTEESGLEIEAEKARREVVSGNLKGAYRAAWDLYHNSFKDNESEFLAAVRKTAIAAINILSPSEIDAAVNIHRKLGYNDDADALLEAFVKARANAQGIFDLENYAFPDHIHDEPLKARFRVENDRQKPKYTLREAVYKVMRHEGYSVEHAMAIRAATADDFYSFFKEDHGSKLDTVISTCIKFPDGRENGENVVMSRVFDALEKIGRESNLNALRATRHGLNPERLAR